MPRKVGGTRFKKGEKPRAVPLLHLLPNLPRTKESLSCGLTASRISLNKRLALSPFQLALSTYCLYKSKNCTNQSCVPLLRANPSFKG